MTNDLIAFINARYDEREQAATAATPGPWTVDSTTYAESISTPDGTYVVAGGRWGDEASVFETTEDAIHIALHNPEAVLADIAAKRRILERHANYDYPFDPEDGPGSYSWTGRCDHCHEPWPCPDLRDLALPFSRHPDYQQEWAPDGQ